MKTYFTIMFRMANEKFERGWYVEEFPVSDSCYRFQLKNGLAFKTFKECKDAIYERIALLGGRYIDHVPSVGVKDCNRKRKSA